MRTTILLGCLALLLLSPPAGGVDVPPCVGDCNEINRVGVSDVVRGVGIALGQLRLETCPTLDPDGSGRVSISELVVAVGNLLQGCPQPPPFVPVCGDAILSLPDEQCDDANADDGDGCSSACDIEAPGPVDLAVLSCPGTSGGALLVHLAEPIGQTFAASAPALSGVAVYAVGRSSAVLELRVRAGSIDGPIVGSASSTRDVGYARLFTFAEPLPVRPGFAYVLEVSEAEDNVSWASADGCGNPAGVAFAFGEPVGVPQRMAFLFMTFAALP